MSRLESRLSKLESVGNEGRLICVIGPEHLDTDATLIQRQVERRAGDLVISVWKPSDHPVSVTVDGITVA